MKNTIQSSILVKAFVGLVLGGLGGGGLAVGTARAAAPAADLYEFRLRDLDGKEQAFTQYRGKVLLVVNTASQCGYTSQYAGLQKLQTRFRDRGLVVLGFPSNDFGGQEPGSNAQIKYFCKSNYAVDFPMFEKAPVTGKGIQPFYSWLISHAPSSEAVGWNFEKFLVGKEGAVVARFKSGVAPESASLLESIEKALGTAPAR